MFIYRNNLILGECLHHMLARKPSALFASVRNLGKNFVEDVEKCCAQNTSVSIFVSLSFFLSRNAFLLKGMLLTKMRNLYSCEVNVG